MLIELTDIQAEAALCALRGVATARGMSPLTAADRRALDAFARFVSRRDEPVDVDALPDATPARLAGVLEPAHAADDRVPAWYHAVS